MITRLDTRESVTWIAFGLALEARSPARGCISVVMRRVGSASVLWDGEFPACERTLDDLPNDDFTREVLARVIDEQADSLDGLVYDQDDLRGFLRGIAAAVPEPYRL